MEQAITGWRFPSLKVPITGFLLVLLLVPIATSLGSVHANESNASLLSTCNASLIPHVIAAEAQIDSNAAIGLAENNSAFIAAVNGQTYTFSGVATSYSFNTVTCSDLSLKSVSVNFYLPSVGSVCDNTKIPTGIQVLEDPSLAHVINVQVNSGECAANSPNWDGYQVHTTYGGTQTNQVYSTTSFSQPTASSNSYCNQSPYVCAVLVWSGLSNQTYSTNPAFIAQTGTEAEMNCTSLSCPSPSYVGWYEFYPGGLNQCTGDTVNTGDSMQALAENGYYWGGASNAYRTFLFDDTGTGWICSSGSQTAPSGTGITSYAETVVERPKIAGHLSVLATFNSGSSLTLSGSQECYYLSSLQNPLQCTGFYNDIQTEITMQNSCNGTNTNNISTGSLDSGSTFTETFSTACGTTGG